MFRRIFERKNKKFEEAFSSVEDRLIQEYLDKAALEKKRFDDSLKAVGADFLEWTMTSANPYIGEAQLGELQFRIFFEEWTSSRLMSVRRVDWIKKGSIQKAFGSVRMFKAWLGEYLYKQKQETE